MPSLEHKYHASNDQLFRFVQIGLAQNDEKDVFLLLKFLRNVSSHLRNPHYQTLYYLDQCS